MSRDDPALFVHLADTYRHSGDYGEALRVLRRGIERHPSYVPGYELLGRTLLEQGRVGEASICFERVLEMDQHNVVALNGLEEVTRRGYRSQVRTPEAAPPRASSSTPVWTSTTSPGWSAMQPNPNEKRGLADRDVSPPITASFTVGSRSPIRGTPAANTRPEPAAPPFVEEPPPPPISRPEQVPQPSILDAEPMVAELPDEGTHGNGSAPVPGVEQNTEAQELETALERHRRTMIGDSPPRAGLVDATAVALADMLVGLLEFRDPFFRGGSSLTRLLATSIGHELRLADDVVNAVALGAVLRDLGQLPLRNTLNRPGSDLPDDVRRNMERHVEAALAALDGIDLPEITRDTIRCHHEHWDGGGYPEGLAGQEIPLGARIVAAADAFVAMISTRAHRLAKRVPVALEDIRKDAGTHFDPAVVDALDRVINNANWKGPGFALRRHVLIVDPDESRAMVTATRLCAHGYLAEVAFNIESADDRLEKSRVSGIVISTDLKAEDENVLLRRVRETARNALIPIVMTETSDSDRVTLLEAGADVCLNRGASFEELKATLDAFLRREDKAQTPSGTITDTGFTRLRGDISDFPLNWLLQVLNYDSRTAGVFLVTTGDEGAIYLEGGNPRHAQTRHLSGEEALRAMLMWKTGAFSVEPDARSEARTIHASLMTILLHSAAEEDHATFFGQIRN